MRAFSRSRRDQFTLLIEITCISTGALIATVETRATDGMAEHTYTQTVRFPPLRFNILGAPPHKTQNLVLALSYERWCLPGRIVATQTFRTLSTV